jgi:tRNA-modifying protein YgfZ
VTAHVFVSPTEQRRVDVVGDDRLIYLENVTTQRLDDAPVAALRGALVLDPHGLPLAMFDVVVLGDRLALLTPDDDVATFVVDTLGRRTFLMDARFTRTDDRAVAVRGDGVGDLLGGLGLGHVEGRCRMVDDLLIVPRPRGADLFGATPVLEEIIEALVEAGARRGNEDDLLHWRVHHGVPAWGVEVAAPHLPEEAGMLPTHVHLAKGCYPGQEAVARMWMLGRPRRRLAVVEVEGKVEAGAPIGEGRSGVTVTSVTPEGGVALAFVPPGATAGDEVAASPRISVRRLVGDESPPGHDPAVHRRRDTRAAAPAG